MEMAGKSLITGRVALPYHIFFDSLPPEHLDFFKDLRSYHRTPDVVCSHGGLDPTIGPAEAQSREALLWGTDEFVKSYAGEDIIVYGHWRNCVIGKNGHPEPRITNGKAFGIDTISEGVLTAFRFPELKVYHSST